MKNKSNSKTQETWKSIPGYNGFYQVSNFGRVKSTPRKLRVRRGYRMSKEQILKPFSDRCGYFQLTLSKNGKIKRFFVHRIVLSSFIGHSDESVDHIDGDKHNNNLYNLEYLPLRENITRYNIKKNKTSKYTGVCRLFGEKKWRAYIGINCKTKYLGIFKTEEDAAKKYTEYLNQINKPTKLH